MSEPWRLLLRGISGDTRELAAGDALFGAGDPARAIFAVEKGEVRLERAGVTVHTAQAGSLFAETALFADSYDCDAVAVRESVVRSYPRMAVSLHLRAHRDLSLAFTAYLARQLQETRGRVEVLRLKNAGERVLAFLATQPAEDGIVRLDQPLTAVAGEIGLTHEALYRTLTRLARNGRITRLGRREFRLTP
ncbi:MAG TPA: Crp/Fnr family transcriptional regulator [Candidatus Omnitrophota bacterium]|nr:Crp/Fnr family transcriptional regulator [Candidatus Omnitrophota bacterium]